MSALRIALLTYATKPRGSVIHTLALADALTDLGHTVGVFALDKAGQGFEQAPRAATHLIPAAPAPADIDRLIQQRIQEFVTGLATTPQRYDLYHAQDCIAANALLEWRSPPSPALNPSPGPIPIVRTIHHVEDYDSPYLQACQDRSIREPDLRLCVSDRWQQILQQNYGIVAPRVINGVDGQRFSAIPNGLETSLRQRYGLIGTPIYLTVGGIEPRKNSIRLLQAFAQVRQTHPSAQLVIAGGATLFDYQPYRDAFFQAVAALELPIGEALILPGVIPAADLPVLYRAADVFCFPSVKEGWGLVVMEAIASGLPVLTANAFPFTEFLTPAQAQLVDPEDSGAIAQAMRALADPTHARPLVAASQAILPHYTWHRSAEMHLSHYHALLAQIP